VRDGELSDKIVDLHRKHRSVYGLRKLWKAAIRDDIDIGRDHLGRLMGALGLRGVVRGKTKRTTIVDEQAARPADLVDRQFRAAEPNRLWVADITYVPTWSGFCYVAFVTDVFSRTIVGWQVSTSLRAELALDALEQAIWRRGREVSGLIHHSDRGGQYLSIRYSERLASEGAVTSVGSRGDSYDNAMAESVHGLYKAECVWREGPWRGRSDLEIATASWVSWWNDERLHSELDYVPPAEFEDLYYRQKASALAVGNQ
jgi:putative transposase